MSRPSPEFTVVLIGELAAAAGVSTRALRHYEDRGLLVPGRTANGYRRYGRQDVTRVMQIQLMIGAGLGTSTIRRYLDCARTDERGTFLHMCPDLRAALDEVAGRLDERQAQLTETRLRLRTRWAKPAGAWRTKSFRAISKSRTSKVSTASY